MSSCKIVFYKNGKHVPFKDALAIHSDEDVFARRVQESIDKFMKSGDTIKNEYDDGVMIVVEEV